LPEGDQASPARFKRFMPVNQEIIMMTFADRERAIEAYYAARQLAEFLKRSHRWLELGCHSA